VRQSLTVEPRLAWNSKSFCLSLPNSGITDTHHVLLKHSILMTQIKTNFISVTIHEGRLASTLRHHKNYYPSLF
jgi:hypothetical protein